MITITSEFIGENWTVIQDGGICPVSLIEWDEGDAYTQASIGTNVGSTVLGALVLEDRAVSDFSIIVRFSKEAFVDRTTIYVAPDGGRYGVSGERRTKDGDRRMDVRLPHLLSSLDSRRIGLIETDLLANRSICVVGLGTGGVHIAIELAKAGVGRFSLLDEDRLEIGNISRHHAGVSFVGRRKVYAARDLLLETNPGVMVDVYPFHAEGKRHNELRTIISNSDLVICATDNRPSKLLVNALCVETDRPCIFGGAFRRAYGGQVLRVRPHQSCCYHCFVLAMPDTEADREISSETDALAIAYTDQPAEVQPGLSVDVAPISIMATKLALQELIRGKKSCLHVLDPDLSANWYLWINRAEPGTKYASWPPMSESSDAMTVLRWYGIHLDIDPSCPTCGDFEQALKDSYGVDGGSSHAPESRPFPSLLTHDQEPSRWN